MVASPPLRPLCPHLPPPLEELDYRYLRALGPARDGEFYLRALTYGQTLWQTGLTARAILATTRALYADLRDDPEASQAWPLPFAAIAWLIIHHPGDSFLGNPRISFQHQADRVRGSRAAQKSARAWAVWHLVRVVRPDLPGDPFHRVPEPDREAVGQRLDTFGLPGELATWRHALALAADWARRD